MTIETKWSKGQRLREVVISECVDLEEFQQYRAQLDASQSEGHAVSFIDVSRLEECDFGFDSIAVHAESTGRRFQGRTLVEVIWAPSDLAFGLARMYQNLSRSNVEVLIFRDEDEARAAVADKLAASTHV